MSGRKAFVKSIRLAAFTLLVASAHHSFAQGWQAQAIDGKTVYTLATADTVWPLDHDLLLVREAGHWMARRTSDGERIAGPVVLPGRKTSFGWIFKVAEGGCIGFPAEMPMRPVPATYIYDAGQGWAAARFEPGSYALYHKQDGQPIACPSSTDSVQALSHHLILYFSKKKAGLLHITEGHLRVSLPSVFDSIIGPCQGNVLAWSAGKAQLYQETGKPVYKGAFSAAAFLNRHWLAGRTAGGWQAIHLASLQTLSSRQMPVAVGKGHCLIVTAKGESVYDSTGKVAGHALQAALAQQGTDRLIVRRAGKWYLLSPPGQLSVHLKTPTIQMLGPYIEGLAALCSQAGLWGFADAAGYMRISPRYKACKPYSGGLAAVQIGDKWGLIDKSERFVCQPVCDSVEALSEAAGWLCHEAGHVSVFRLEAKLAEYLDAYPASPYLLVRQVSGWGMATVTGKMLIPAWHTSLQSAGPDRFLAQRANEWAVLSAANQLVYPWQARPIVYDGGSSLFFVKLHTGSSVRD